MEQDQAQDSCDQTVGCGQELSAAMSVYIPLLIIFAMFLIFVSVIFSRILKEPTHRSCRAILMFATLVIYSCCEGASLLVSIIYCCGIFIEYSTKFYTSIQLIRSLIFMAALLVSISAGCVSHYLSNKLAWQLKFRYRVRSANTATFITDIFLVVMYGGICAYFFITLLAVKFNLSKLQLNHLCAGLFFLIIAIAFALVKLWVYLSLRQSYQHLYLIFRQKMLLSSVIITVALVIRSLYDFITYALYDFYTEEQSKYFDLVLMTLCEVLPLGAGALSMLFSLRHSQNAMEQGVLNHSLSDEIRITHHDSYQSHKRYAQEIASQIINTNTVDSFLTDQDLVYSARQFNPTISSQGEGHFSRADHFSH